MTNEQAYVIEQFQSRLKITNAELLVMAREAAGDARLLNLHQMDDTAAHLLIDALDHVDLECPSEKRAKLIFACVGGR